MSDIEAFIDEISVCNEKERLKMIMEYGSTLQHHKHTDHDKVPGCVSDAYVSCEKQGSTMHYTGWAESLIIRGYVKLLIDILDNKTPDEILASDDYVLKLMNSAKLNVSLTPSRTNSFKNIYDFMKKIIR